MSYNVSGNAQRERSRKTEKIIKMIYGESLRITTKWATEQPTTVQVRVQRLSDLATVRIQRIRNRRDGNYRLPVIV